MLLVEDLRVTFGERPILGPLSFELPEIGSTALVGPVGAGKSTLLRTLAGHLDGVHGLVASGRVEGSAELERRPAALVGQSARLLVRTVFENLAAGLQNRGERSIADQREGIIALLARHGLEAMRPHLDQNVVELSLGQQRLVAIARCLAADSALLLVDEPTSGLDEQGRRAVVSLLARAATERHVLCVTHNRRDALELDGQALLLVDGKIRERGPARELFERPRTPEGELFASTGSCLGVPRTAPPQDLGPARAPAPSAFHWIRQGVLGGVQRPGLLADLDQDLRGLSDLGITTLVCLEETRTVPQAALASHGIASLHFPIPDMGAPSVDSGIVLCAELHDRMRAGERVAVHCRAGLGRTGTVLSALLIYGGATALEALDAVRRVQWKFVQSEAQLDFLSELEARLVDLRAAEAPGVRTREGAQEALSRCR